jgi:hypothetical protein
MKGLIFLAVGLVLGFAACQGGGGSAIQLNDQRDKVGYSIGLDIGSSIRQQQVDIDADILVRGIKDGITQADPMLTDAEIQEVMMAFQQEMMQRQMQQQQQMQGGAMQGGAMQGGQEEIQLSPEEREILQQQLQQELERQMREQGGGQ